MARQKWSLEAAREWRARVGWQVGCNFTPSTAGNQLEMWQSSHFDSAAIDRELGWARSWGMNTVRVYLHDLLYAREGNAFLERLDEVLDLCEKHGLRMIPVLFDGVWNPDPIYGPQPEPRPRLHNSMWVQSPGRAVLYDRSRWSELHPYVEAVIRTFRDDERVLMWDLFNEPDQIDADTLSAGNRDRKSAHVVELLVSVFEWALAESPIQPLSVGLWEYDEAMKPVDNELNRLVLDRSDVISFHCYGNRHQLEMLIDTLEIHERPLVCTEWLARTAGSTVDLLEVFASRNVDAINWGLVDGRTQTKFPWRSWWEEIDDDEPWFHELIHADGTPYSQIEAEIFRRVTSSKSMS